MQWTLSRLHNYKYIVGKFMNDKYYKINLRKKYLAQNVVSHLRIIIENTYTYTHTQKSFEFSHER